MWTELGNILGNSHFEAYVGGPLAGAIAGFIFAALGTRGPSGDAGNELSPYEALARVEYELRRRRELDGRAESRQAPTRSGSRTAEDGGPLLIGLGIASLVVLFLFTAFLPQIAFWLSVFILTVGMFSITATCLGFVTGRFNSPHWWRCAIFPLVVSLLCFFIMRKAREAIGPELTLFAQQLLGEHPITVNSVFRGAFAFFRALNNEYVNYMLLIMLAFVLITICAVIAFLQTIHYAALSNSRASGNAIWYVLALNTARFSSTGSIVFVSLLLALSWFLATGSVFRLFDN